jgi:hypothetical protein
MAKTTSEMYGHPLMAPSGHKCASHLRGSEGKDTASLVAMDMFI